MSQPIDNSHPATPAPYSGPVFDACVHHTWTNQLEVMEYMGAGWKEFLGRPNLMPDGSGLLTITAGNPYRRPGGDKLEGTASKGGAPGSSYDLLKEHVLGNPHLRKVILSFDTGAYTPALADPHATAEIARAANDWTIDRWLSIDDDRLMSLMLVPNQLPDHAAAEIRRVGTHPKIAGVLLGSNGLGKGFGHPVYHPIYEAAAEMGLPVVLKVGSEATPDTPTNPAAGGTPSTYSEYRILAAQPIMTHVASFIAQGVFEKFPSLRLFVEGAGAIWVPTLIWHYDTDYRAFRREVPWVRRLPSEYFYEHVRVSTNPFDKAPSTEQLRRAYASVGRLEEVLCFASGYPDADSDTADAVARELPESWLEKVMHDNAAELFSRDAKSSVRRETSSVVVGQL